MAGCNPQIATIEEEAGRKIGQKNENGASSFAGEAWGLKKKAAYLIQIKRV